MVLQSRARSVVEFCDTVGRSVDEGSIASGHKPAVNGPDGDMQQRSERRSAVAAESCGVTQRVLGSNFTAAIGSDAGCTAMTVLEQHSGGSWGLQPRPRPRR